MMEKPHKFKKLLARLKDRVLMVLNHKTLDYLRNMNYFNKYWDRSNFPFTLILCWHHI